MIEQIWSVELETVAFILFITHFTSIYYVIAWQKYRQSFLLYFQISWMFLFISNLIL